jgi:hypothetical protein
MVTDIDLAFNPYLSVSVTESASNTVGDEKEALLLGPRVSALGHRLALER